MQRCMDVVRLARVDCHGSWLATRSTRHAMGHIPRLVVTDEPVCLSTNLWNNSREIQKRTKIRKKKHWACKPPPGSLLEFQSRIHSGDHSNCDTSFPIGTEPPRVTVFEIFASQYIWDIKLTFIGNVTIWYPGTITYRYSTLTESPFSSIFEIISDVTFVASKNFMPVLTKMFQLVGTLSPTLLNYPWSHYGFRPPDPFWSPPPAAMGFMDCCTCQP